MVRSTFMNNLYIYSKMEFFNFVETFFFISLAITFVLIMMLVYHFKERLTVLEKKTNTMFDIVNNIVQELNYIRNKSDPQKMNPPTSIPLSNIFSQINNKIFVSDEDSNEDSDDETQHEEEEEEEIQQEYPIKRINIDLNTKEEEMNDIDIDEINESEYVDEDEDENEDEQPEINVEEINESSESLMESYKKLDVSALRNLVISKGLTRDAKKMKKTELLKLLESA